MSRHKASGKRRGAVAVSSQGHHRRRRRPKRREGTAAIIDGLLLRPVAITFNGEAMQVPAIEAILLQLLEKGRAGNNRAWRVLLQFQEFARRRSKKELELRFVDNDYTRALATSKPENENG
jgi:hypothetical protein